MEHQPKSVSPPVPTVPSIPDTGTDRGELARRGWLTMVIARQALARCTAIIEEWRLLLAMRRTGRAHCRGSWRRLAHAAASLLLVFGGIVRGIGEAWPVAAATIPFTGQTIDGGFAGANSATYADLDNDGDIDVRGAAVGANDITWWQNKGGQFTLVLLRGGRDAGELWRVADRHVDRVAVSGRHHTLGIALEVLDPQGGGAYSQRVIASRESCGEASNMANQAETHSHDHEDPHATS